MSYTPDPISSSDNTLDSRDIEARLEWLRDKRDAARDAAEELEAAPEDMAEGERAKLEERAEDALDEDEAEELRLLEDIENDLPGEELLIRDSYFRRYAQELAEDCGMLKGGESWPYTCIDWEWATRELQMDYSSLEFDGVTFWYRS